MYYYVYILTNHYQGTLYIGVTSNLGQRIHQHRNKSIDGFSSKYHLDKLVYYEQFSEIDKAILREKQLKKWQREWKMRLINEFNPDWIDLYDSIL